MYQRPGLTEFRDYCFTEFEVAVWTSADHSYATEVVSHLFGTPQRLRFVWTAERCTQRTNFETHERYAVKDLRKVHRLGIVLERVLMVDDKPEGLERNYGNHIQVSAFAGDPSDRELPLLSRYLRSIRNHPNYRKLEKRFWRSTIPLTH